MQNKKKVNNIEYTIQKKCKSTAIKNQEIALTEDTFSSKFIFAAVF